MRAEWHGVVPSAIHGIEPSILAGPRRIATAWYFYVRRIDLPAKVAAGSAASARCWSTTKPDKFNAWFFAGGFRRIGTLFSNVGDKSIIDGFFVNGNSRRRCDLGPAAPPATGGVYRYGS
jgi:NADH-quinone oxidoreductase subunit L